MSKIAMPRVDFNFVMAEDGEFVEMQGSGEEATFSGEAARGDAGAGEGWL